MYTRETEIERERNRSGEKRERKERNEIEREMRKEGRYSAPRERDRE
jgi:hypothetical protein